MRISETIRDEVIARDKRICQYCGKGKLYKRQLHLDHIIPESADGQFTPSNLIVACKACNTRKGNKPQSLYISDRLKQIEREKFHLELLSKQ
jgi:5-methylcytosine-specific restriction endonuclease McrA